MELGLTGLGRMGANMARRLVRGGHRVVVGNRSEGPVRELMAEGAEGSFSDEELVSKLRAPRAIWVMLPAGDVTEQKIESLRKRLSRGDIVVEAGNTQYKDDIRRAESLKKEGIHYVDQGTSGGIWGLTEGYSLMVGGAKEDVERIRPALETLAPAPDKGWGHCGPVGAGHYVKMIHNGIEYGMMQAFAEGFEILKSKKEFDLDLAQIAELWRVGSVVRSWLLDLCAASLKENPNLDGIAPYVADSGEGRWTIFESIDQDVPAPVLALSLMARFASRRKDSFGDKLLAAMRNQFGGHAIKKD